ncbi:hypothetical protein MTO98_23700 [Mucilaginibacter sp. SMC90]|uniref:hypothetical protein n=1 Tax=Mucilaginibacter sp. SMC90 TaxID=2929803 RepID=UPI001FB54357|nr:hypothetical protein [Mucilaginibacter sp. SMC90]UOE47415.1 hypothetical protein MTO98_23700 [Mucilaginibacter sp. SMC90]
MAEKDERFKEEVFQTEPYRNELKYLKKITFDYIHALQMVAIYSTRAKEIYDEFLTIHVIDELIESAIGVMSLVESGIHNMPKRELRYLIELVTKYVIIDYALMGDSLDNKKQYLLDEIPKSSITVIDRYATPFAARQTEFRNEVKDFFYKACAYVHPSKKQLDEQIRNRRNGHTMGYESTAMLSDINKLIFRAYDMILVMIFHGFGPSMSKDVFEQMLDNDKTWKYHKGKYIPTFRKDLN